MTSSIVQQVQAAYSQFEPSMIKAMPTIYRADIVFQDPLQRIEGLENLIRYYTGMFENLLECRFEFNQVVENTGERSSAHVQQAVLFWTMHYRHRKLAGGTLLSINGNSHIKYQDKVFYHRDYYDAGAMLYEHLPVLGWAINLIKKRTEA